MFRNIRTWHPPPPSPHTHTHTPCYVSKGPDLLGESINRQCLCILSPTLAVVGHVGVLHLRTTNPHSTTNCHHDKHTHSESTVQHKLNRTKCDVLWLHHSKAIPTNQIAAFLKANRSESPAVANLRSYTITQYPLAERTCDPFSPWGKSVLLWGLGTSSASLTQALPLQWDIPMGIAGHVFYLVGLYPTHNWVCYYWIMTARGTT